MPYNDSESAKNFTGVEVNEALLNVAHSLIHQYTQLRWETTLHTLTFSGNGKGYKFINIPIIALTSLTEIDLENDTETEYDVYTDYNFVKETGRVDFFTGFTKGYNNWEIVYTYGYSSSQEDYEKVRFAEASLGVMLTENPLLLTEITLTGGDKMMFNASKAEGSGAGQAVKNLMRNLGIPVRRLFG